MRIKPYIKAAAVVGIKGLLQVALVGITKATGRSFSIFDTCEAAMDWLAGE